jgi:glycosyltransferase involved in cell wall biosynthesis
LIATVIIPVYNAVRYLELVLAGFSRQSCRSFEVIIADDGSGPEVNDLLSRFIPGSPFPLRHVYQPDEGFRKTRILNAAIRTASTDYLIMSDGDCIPHHDFVQAHWQHRAPRAVLCGRRVMLGREMSARLTVSDVLDGRYERFTPDKIIDVLLGRSSHWDEAIPLKSARLHSLIYRKNPTLVGCNFSLEKSLIEKINGFNEDFAGYGGEDIELEYRLRLEGAGFKWVTHRAIQYHLYHLSRQANPQNTSLLEQTIAEGKAACRRGLTKAKP